MKKFLLSLLLVLGILLLFNKPEEKKAVMPPPPSELEMVVNKALEGSKGTYGIVIKNLGNGENYKKNSDMAFEAGSLYKLEVMAEVFRQIEKGQIDETEVLKGNIADLNAEFGLLPEEAELSKGTVTLTVKNALEQMITISHNYAAYLLTKKAKISTNLSQTTPQKTADFLEKLYNGELANATSSAAMTNLLKSQKLNEGLPKYLPKEIIVAHKTADIGFYSHDAGIVYTPKGNYILVVLSKSDSPYGAQERVSLISKAVFDFFQN